MLLSIAGHLQVVQRHSGASVGFSRSRRSRGDGTRRAERRGQVERLIKILTAAYRATRVRSSLREEDVSFSMPRRARPRALRRSTRDQPAPAALRRREIYLSPNPAASA